MLTAQAVPGWATSDPHPTVAGAIADPAMQRAVVAHRGRRDARRRRRYAPGSDGSLLRGPGLGHDWFRPTPSDWQVPQPSQSRILTVIARHDGESRFSGILLKFRTRAQGVTDGVRKSQTWIRFGHRVSGDPVAGATSSARSDHASRGRDVARRHRELVTEEHDLRITIEFTTAPSRASGSARANTMTHSGSERPRTCGSIDEVLRYELSSCGSF